MTVQRLLAAAALCAAITAPAAISTPAAALSCVGPGDVIVDASQVYAGEIVDALDGRIHVHVAEVWKGGPVAEEVWLDVELEVWTAWAAGDGEIPDGYSSPETWVFAPDGTTVNACTAWAMDRSMRQHLEPHRPADPQTPVALEGEPGGDELASDRKPATASPWWPRPVAIGLGGVITLGAGAVALAALRRRAA